MNDKKDPFKMYADYQMELFAPKEPKKKKNAKPEQKLKEAFIRILKTKGFDVDIVESKSVMFKDHRGIKHFKSAGVKKGFADLIASDPEGIYCAIELKAPGKLKTVREEQVNFLVRKIQHNCFAMVTDSIDMFFEVYYKWKALSFPERRPFLLNELKKLL